MTVVSQLAEARVSPSGLKATPDTGPMCPERVRISFPVEVSQSFMVLSALAEARILPSGLKARLSTIRMCPLMLRSNSFLETSKMWICLSRVPAASQSEVGLKASEKTAPKLSLNSKLGDDRGGGAGLGRGGGRPQADQRTTRMPTETVVMAA